MKLYTKTVNGRVEIKPASRIRVVRDGMQVFNPTEEILFEDGWEEYSKPEPTLYELKMNKKYEIENYDSSMNVNEFTIQGNHVWLDKATRAGLMLRFESEIALKKQETVLWYNGKQFPLNLNDAMSMLYALEVYASECYDNTQKHLAAVDALETEDEILQYDYRKGYPNKLRF